VYDAGCAAVLDSITICKRNANGERHQGEVQKIQEGQQRMVGLGVHLTTLTLWAKLGVHESRTNVLYANVGP